MTEAGWAIARATCGIGNDVKDDVVGVSRVADEERSRTRNGRSRTSLCHAIQVEIVADAPRDVVIGARRIPADAKPTHNLRSHVIESKAATEHIRPANLLAHQWVVGLPEILRRSLVGLGGRRWSDAVLSP